MVLVKYVDEEIFCSFFKVKVFFIYDVSKVIVSGFGFSFYGVFVSLFVDFVIDV